MRAGRCRRWQCQTREVVHEPASCGECRAALAAAPVTGVDRRQDFDLPPAAVEVTEHQLIERRCACGHAPKGDAPAGADAPPAGHYLAASGHFLGAAMTPPTGTPSSGSIA